MLLEVRMIIFVVRQQEGKGATGPPSGMFLFMIWVLVT